MDLAAASVSFASLAFQLFQGCVQGIAFFNTAQHIGTEGSLFRAGLEFEKYRLITWASKAGLLEDSSPGPRVNWQLATMILEHLSGILTSAEKLQNRYMLNVSEETVQESEKALAASPPKQGLAKLISRLKPDIYTTSGKIIQANNGTLKRMRWAAVGKEKSKRIISEIRDLVDKLEYLLDSADRESRHVEDLRLLRDLVSITSTTVEVGELEEILGDGIGSNSSERAIKAAAHVKQIRLVLGADRREDEVQTIPTPESRSIMPQLKNIKKTLKPWSGTKLRYYGIEFARYNGRQVIVQWKVAEGQLWGKYQAQMKSLAVLLMSFSHKSFRSLRCLGYYPAEDLGRHGIVFSVPTENISWSMKSLSQLIEDEKTVSLSRRVAVAQALAETLLQLHTVGWMHKSLRSDNVIFLAPEGSKNEDFLRSDPFVMGYDYARPDNADAAAAFTQLPETELSAELYRHPQARGLARETYQKRFDVYALGCLVVELAFWQKLVSIQATFTTEGLGENMSKAAESNDTIDIPSLSDLLESTEAVASIRHLAGEQMVEVISTCCCVEKADNGQEASLDAQLGVVEKLSQCKL
ncbi:prion-inhibition and propagation-domain-containing protein [Xylariaceae sp. FL0662B]|nr:prion-inhibition and propagation-domain-containing protein [Xylariaceae sp. FL0662B]